MNKQKLLITSVLIAVTISLTSLAIPTSEEQVILQSDTVEEYSYIPSDITKANPNLIMGAGGYSMNKNMELTKDTVVLTLSGTVLSVGDLVQWNYEGDSYGSVPITIEVDKKTKDKDADLKLKKGDSFTFYLLGIYENDSHYIDAYEPQFEIGEKIIVHVGKSDQGPNGPDGDNYFVELGKYGKYKVVGDKAYNEKHTDGKSLDKVFNEAN